jgi:hypothetical protein
MGKDKGWYASNKSNISARVEVHDCLTREDSRALKHLSSAKTRDLRPKIVTLTL